MRARIAVRALAGCLCATGLVALLAGCGERSTKPRIALIMKSLANEFFKTMQEGAEKHQKAHAADYELIAQGIKDELDVTRQINLVDQMIANRVDAIVIAPADSKALVPVCKKALKAGIVVVNIDNQFDAGVLAQEGVRIPFVGPDNRAGARLAGEYLAKRLKAGDEVALLGGIPSAFNAQQRRLGFEDAMKAAGLKIVAVQSAGWEQDKANQAAAGILSEHPNLRAILCANDSMALGAVAALRAAGKVGKVLVIGYDYISAVQDLMREGAVLCTVDQHGDQIAVHGIEYALEILRTHSTPQDRGTPVDLKPAPAKEGK